VAHNGHHIFTGNQFIDAGVSAILPAKGTTRSVTDCGDGFCRCFNSI
jgi:hypothetical protein